MILNHSQSAPSPPNSLLEHHQLVVSPSLSTKSSTMQPPAKTLSAHPSKRMKLSSGQMLDSVSPNPLDKFIKPSSSNPLLPNQPNESHFQSQSPMFAPGLYLNENMMMNEQGHHKSTMWKNYLAALLFQQQQQQQTQHAVHSAQVNPLLNGFVLFCVFSFILFI